MNEKQEIFISDVFVIEDVEDEKKNCSCWFVFLRLFTRMKRKTGPKKRKTGARFSFYLLNRHRKTATILLFVLNVVNHDEYSLFYTHGLCFFNRFFSSAKSNVP